MKIEIFWYFFYSQANTAAAQGNVEETNTNANYARTLIIVSLCVGIVVLMIAIIVNSISA